ncbi:MAG: MFS transporter, partial [Deltaproteobacteria bacterium]|nr:MFS transporter [Deltaproteobacteria bacterium]
MPRRLIILYVCLYIVMIGYGISLPILPFFMRELAQSQGIGSNQLSLHVGAVTAIFAFMQLLFAPLWGMLSDRTGRRKPLLIMGLTGYVVSMGLAGASQNIATLYAARMLNGIFAAAVLPIAAAYIVDVIPAKHQAQGLAWHGTAVGLGVVSGPILGSVFTSLLAEHPIHRGFLDINKFSGPFFIASLLAAIALIIAAIRLPESVSDPRTPPGGKSAVLLGAGHTTSIISTIAPFLFLSLLSQFGLSLFEGTFVLHAQKTMVFTAAQLGFVFMTCGFVMAAAQGTVVAGFIERLGVGRVLPFGFVFMGTGLLMLMVTGTMGTILLSVAILASGMAIITPSIAVLIARRAKDRLGKGLGMLAGANSIGQTLGPLIGSAI